MRVEQSSLPLHSRKGQGQNTFFALNVNFFRLLQIQYMLHKVQEEAFLHPRTCPSRGKKTLFLKQERHLLQRLL